MPTDVRELRVFMASPSDLKDERQALQNLERRINAMFSERGVRVSISGWEEVQPEAGRPQELINPLVHKCEIFIGLLNMRWGSATGTHSSGFEEEFEIALARRAKEKTPAIGMFFRAIDSERLADKGPQLTEVLAFQDRVTQERLALYKTSSSTDQLALEIFDFLAPHAMRLADEATSTGVETGTAVAGSVPTTVEPAGVESSEAAAPQATVHSPVGTEFGALDSAQQQIVDALNGFAEMFTNGTPLDQSVRDRVTLVGTAFAGNQGFLRVHHVNRLYRQRAHLDLTLGEATAWYRTYFANVGTSEREGHTVPVWGVLDVRSGGPRFIEELTNFIQDEDAEVARGALRFMIRHAIRPEALWVVDRDDHTQTKEGDPETPSSENAIGLWVALFKHFSGLDIALNYVAAVATVDDVPLLTSIAASKNVDEASRTVVSALAGTLTGNLDECEHLAPSKYSSEDTEVVRRLLIDVMPRLTATQWDALLKGTHQAVAAAAAAQLIEHVDVTSEQLDTAIRLDEAIVGEALVRRAGSDVDWAAAAILTVKKQNSHASTTLFSRLLAATISPEALKDLDAVESVSLSYWIARTIQDPEAFKDAARKVLDGTSESLIRRTLRVRVS